MRDLSSSAVVTKNRIVHNQHGNTEQVIIDNLSVLANNVLEPIKAQYPSMFVTSAFRRGNGTSQHERGQAADMQFSGVAKSDYLDIATWIRENVPHDQLILEFKNTGTGLPWIHISRIHRPGTNYEIRLFSNKRKYFRSDRKNLETVQLFYKTGTMKEIDRKESCSCLQSETFEKSCSTWTNDPL